MNQKGNQKSKAPVGKKGLGKEERDEEAVFFIGQRIKDVLADDGRTVTWLAQQMGCSREYLYKVFGRTWISTDLLVRISEAIRHDFFKDYSRTLRFKAKRKGK